jgi:hypothetical protein
MGNLKLGTSIFVIPAKAGIQYFQRLLDPSAILPADRAFRRDDAFRGAQLSFCFLAMTLFLFLLPLRAFALTDNVREENVGIRPSGAPIFSYSSDYGPSFGAHIAFFDYGKGTVKPYRGLYRIQGLFGTNGDFNNYFATDNPEIFGTQFRFMSRFAIQRIGDYNYFGVGNNTSADNTTNDYYHFKRVTPSFHFNLLRKIYGNFYAILGYLWEERLITTNSNSKLAGDFPTGATGGKDSELRFGISYDSRDNEAMPVSGHYIDAFAELPLRAFGSSYNSARFTITDRNYVSICNRLVWANRIIIKASTGTVPFYEMAKIGGLWHFDGLGGGSTIRGIRQSRYIDRAMLLFNEELRLRTFNFYVLKERFDVYVVAFADFGRVMSGLDHISLKGLHPAGGGGLRIQWNKNFSIAPDIGFSKEGYGIYFSFKNMF